MRMVGKRWGVSVLAAVVLVGATGNVVAVPLVAAYEISIGLHAAAAVAVAWWLADDKPVSEAMSQPGLMVTIAKPSDGGAVEGLVRVPGTSGSGSVVPVPTAPASAPVIPGPYSSGDMATAQCCRFDGASCGAYETCAACVVNYAPLTGGRACKATTVTGTSIPQNQVMDTDPATPAINPNPSCATGGYTLSGDVCNLTDARAAVADGAQDFVRSGQTMAAASAADLKGAVNAVLSTKYVSNDTTQVSGWSASNQPRLIQVTALSNGGSELVQYTQKEDGAGGSYLEKRQLTVSPAGVVTSASQSAVSGTLNQSTAATTATGPGYTVTGGTAAYSPSAPGSGTSASGTGTNDYARQGEAASAAASIVSALTGPSITTPDQTSLDARKTAMEGLCNGAACAENSVLNPGSSWMPSFLPGNAPACAPIEFRGAINAGPAAGLDSTTSLDVCWMLDIVRGMFGWLLNIVAIVYIWRRFTNMYNA